VYIGETGRTLEIRVCEHKKSVAKHDPNISKLTEHVENTGHKFAWDQAKVIGREKKWKARKIHEAAEIMRHGDDAN
jgi:hypothetical protein